MEDMEDRNYTEKLEVTISWSEIYLYIENGLIRTTDGHTRGGKKVKEKGEGRAARRSSNSNSILHPR